MDPLLAEMIEHHKRGVRIWLSPEGIEAVIELIRKDPASSSLSLENDVMAS